MSEPLVIDVVTIFPRMLDSILGESMLKRAIERGYVVINTVNLRDFTHDVHKTTDDRPYGGGPGMIMKPEPIFEAVESLRRSESRVILMSPRGQSFKQSKALQLAEEKHLIFICGHYEGVDERVREALITDEISIGDYILTNGVLATAVVIDAVVRLQKGVLGGGETAVSDESFSSGLLEYPQYTRPAVYRGMKVPSVLSSGNHLEIAKWRKEQSLRLTKSIRPDILDD